MEAIRLIEELIQAMRRDGYADQSNELQELLNRLVRGSDEERTGAAKAISANCHLKYYGDLNVEMPGSGSDPLWNHLSKIQKALAAL